MRNRGFEKVERLKDVDFNLPKRSTKFSAGYDFESLMDVEILPGEVKLVHTGVKAYMNEDEVLELYIRSSISKKGIVLQNSVGIIDADYYNNPDNEGEIAFMFKNTTDEVFKIKKGDRIGQGIFKKFLKVDNEEEITEIRTGGYGSTNKKGITLIALAVTVIVLIIIISTNVYLTVYNLQQSKINNYLSEVNIIQNAVLEEMNLAKVEKREIRESLLVWPLTTEEVNDLKNQGYLTSEGYNFYYLFKAELEILNVKNIDTSQEFIVNWDTAEVLNSNVAEYNGVIIKSGNALTLPTSMDLSLINYGDTVLYDPTIGAKASQLTYTSPVGSALAGSNVSGNGHSEQIFTATSADNEWIVIGKENNQLKLLSKDVKIPNNPVTIDGNTGFGMKDGIAWLYAEEQLHNACKIYGYGNGANKNKITSYQIGNYEIPGETKTKKNIGSGARSLTIEDLQEITNFPLIISRNDANKTRPTVSVYVPSLNAVTPEGKSQNSNMQKNIPYTHKVISQSDFENNIKDGYSGLINKLFINAASYLASRCQYSYSDTQENYTIKSLGTATVNGCSVASGFSNQFGSFQRAYTIRPVVYLKSNVKLENQSEGVWKVKQQ